jgi:hypothetical protein
MFSTHALAEKKTVCTITVNSDDEKETFRQRLPKGQYEFVELVEQGRPDWLRSSCQKGIQCDVLVVSGHFNAGDDFYSDRLENNEYLRVDELERASCSGSCPGIFAKLKEVYLFGCESLNPDATTYASSYGESGRDRMRRLFANVPVIYGFSSSAPVGPTAAMLLNRYFDSGAARALGTGRPNSRLLSVFKRNSMTSVAGVRDNEPLAAHRRQVCQFYDERQSPAQKLDVIHRMMREDMDEAQRSFARIEKLFESLSEAERQAPAFVQSLAVFSADEATRGRYLAITREERLAALRARKIALAATLGWLSPEARRAQVVAMINDLLASPGMGYAEVDLVCSLNDGRELDPELDRVKLPAGRPLKAAHAAAMACLGSPEAHGEVLRALASPDEKEVQIAQVYLRHRPISDRAELRHVAKGIAGMASNGAKVRALDTLARLHIADREILGDLARSFAAAKSAEVQRAIAEVFIRSDQKAIDKPDVLAVVREYRLRPPGGGEDLVDVLVRRLQGS